MEDPEASDKPDMDLKSVYEIMMRICRLKHVQTFIFIHLIAKIGFQANDAVTGLKLVEKGFGKEDLALTVLIDFPFQIVLGYLAARWSKGENALRPWLIGYVARLGFAIISMAIVAGFPTSDGSSKSAIPTSYFILIAVTTVTASFASTVQFVGISAFHTQIADPLIGGTYMTLLNTVSNLGGTWPRPLVLKSVDYFTVSRCALPLAKEGLSNVISDTLGLMSNECTSDDGKAHCRALGGTCIIERDGYYWTSAICVIVGTIVLFTYIRPKSKQLQSLPAAAWRVSLEKSHAS
jgi:PAT family acetyl-CoA transporter-like MFS transporter 1